MHESESAGTLQGSKYFQMQFSHKVLNSYCSKFVYGAFRSVLKKKQTNKKNFSIYLKKIKNKKKRFCQCMGSFHIRVLKLDRTVHITALKRGALSVVCKITFS